MTTDYKTVFQLAQDKGYKTKYVWPATETIMHDQQQLLEQTYLIELTLIQKWLRDESSISVVVGAITETKFFYSLEFLKGLTGNSTGVRMVNELLESEKKGYKAPTLKEHENKSYSYESALLEGIHEALKLI